MYSGYVTFQDIKEIINKSTNTSSFGILSEVKQYINQVNSQENTEFISNLKIYLSDNKTTNTSESNNNFTEQLKHFISEQNSYSQETFNNVINPVTNKFENKSALILNQIINENVLKLNQVYDTLYSSVSNNESKESILNTLSTFANNLLVLNQDTINNNEQQSTYSSASFKLDQEFKDTIQKIVTSTNTEQFTTELSIFKQEVFNNAISTVNKVMNQSNTKVESYDSFVENQTLTVDEKIQNILKSFNETSNNQSLSAQEIKNIEIVKNYLLSESYKLELINKISYQDLFVVNKFDEFENEITTKINQYLISSSFVENVNNFRTQISQKSSVDEVMQYSSEQKTVILNDVKNLVSDFVSVVNPEYLTTENLNTFNNATSIDQITNLLTENNSQFTTSENSTISNIINQSSAYSKIVDSVTNSILNDNNFTQNTLLQKVDSVVYNVIQKQFNTISTSLIQNIITKFEQSYGASNTYDENVEFGSEEGLDYVNDFDLKIESELEYFQDMFGDIYDELIPHDFWQVKSKMN